MSIFELRVSGWTGNSAYHLLSHPSRTQEEFEQEVTKLLQEKGEEYIAKEECWVSNNSWVDYIVPFMIEDLGYSKANIQGLAWTEEGIIREDGEKRTGWRNTVGADLYEKALSRNKDIEIEMRKDWKMKKTSKEDIEFLTDYMDKNSIEHTVITNPSEELLKILREKQKEKRL